MRRASRSSPAGYLATLSGDFQGDVDALFESGRRIAVHLVGSGFLAVEAGRGA